MTVEHTSNFSIPYPDFSEPARVPDDIEDLANSVDGLLASKVDIVQAFTTSGTISASGGRVVTYNGPSSKTLTLPSGASGLPFELYNLGSNTFTLARAGSDSINGGASITILPGQVASIRFLGSGIWILTQRNVPKVSTPSALPPSGVFDGMLVDVAGVYTTMRCRSDGSSAWGVANGDPKQVVGSSASVGSDETTVATFSITRTGIYRFDAHAEFSFPSGSGGGLSLQFGSAEPFTGVQSSAAGSGANVLNLDISQILELDSVAGNVTAAAFGGVEEISNFVFVLTPIKFT